VVLRSQQFKAHFLEMIGDEISIRTAPTKHLYRAGVFMPLVQAGRATPSRFIL
jgi:hypothetical protein